MWVLHGSFVVRSVFRRLDTKDAVGREKPKAEHAVH